MSLTSANARVAWGTKQAVEAAYRDGAPRHGEIGKHGGVKTAMQVAALVLQVSAHTVQDRCSSNGLLARHGVTIDWERPGSESAPTEASLEERTAERLAKERETQAKSDMVADLRARLKASHREALTEDILREKIMGLAAQPLRPPSWPILTTSRGKAREAVLLCLSDLHWGEVINLDAMGGRNSFDTGIAHARLHRYFSHVCELGTEFWGGPPPAVIYLALLGDLVSGEIHEELAKTNDLLAIPAVKDLTDHLIAGIDLLLKTFACDIRVVSTPGNHGRTTLKPETKGFAVNSYDTLVMWLLERWYLAREEKRVSFSAPVSGDALVTINGWNILLTHGDRIGSKMGQGFIGPAATAARGMKKLLQDYVAEGTIVDMIVMGHLHTALELEEGFVNPSFSGPSEFSRSGRMRSKPAAQWMLTIHPRRCPARRWLVAVGAPAEGSLYKERA